MRIVSLSPAATEIVAALGATESLVGVSHQCDFPPGVERLPRVTMTAVDSSLASGAIDRAVRTLRAAGRAVIAVDAVTLHALAPDLILAPGLWDVCAVAGGEVRRLAQALERPPRVLALHAHDLAGIWRDVRAVAEALGRTTAADRLLAELDERLATLGGGTTRRSQALGIPQVICIEWLDPVYLAGHWVPELVRLAGGEDVGAEPGSRSLRRSWEEVRAARPNQLLVMLRGLNLERAAREVRELVDPAALDLLDHVPTWLLDGNAYTSRPGPRVVDGAERIRAAIEGRELAGLRRWVRA